MEDTINIRVNDQSKNIIVPLFKKGEDYDEQQYLSYNWDEWCFWNGIKNKCQHVTCLENRKLFSTTTISNIGIVSKAVKKKRAMKLNLEIDTIMKEPKTIDFFDIGVITKNNFRFAENDKFIDIFYNGYLEEGIHYIHSEYICASDKFTKFATLSDHKAVSTITVTEKCIVVTITSDYYFNDELIGKISKSCDYYSILMGIEHFNANIIQRKLNLYTYSSLFPNYYNMNYELRNDTQICLESLIKLLGGSIINKAYNNGLDRIIEFAMPKKLTANEQLMLSKWNGACAYVNQNIEEKDIKIDSFDNSIRTNTHFSEKAFILIKPTGVMARNLKIIIDSLTKMKIFTIIDFVHGFNLPTEIFDMLYPNIMTKTYGPSWFTYITNGIYLALVVGVESIYKLRHKILKIREKIDIPYPINSLHCSDSSEEAIKNLEIFEKLKQITNQNGTIAGTNKFPNAGTTNQMA